MILSNGVAKAISTTLQSSQLSSGWGHLKTTSNFITQIFSYGCLDRMKLKFYLGHFDSTKAFLSQILRLSIDTKI